MGLLLLDNNASYADRCGMYAATAAELVVAKAGSGKNDYIRFSLQKIKKNGRVDRLGFSHYFNVGIKELVDEYKRLGVTDKGISAEDLAKAKEMYKNGDTDCEFQFYGFFWNQPLGGVFKHKETGKVTSETLAFIPCDEDTSIPKPEWAMTQARLNDILSNYEKVEGAPAEEERPTNSASAEEEAEFEEFMKRKREGKI